MTRIVDAVAALQGEPIELEEPLEVCPLDVIVSEAKRCGFEFEAEHIVPFLLGYFVGTMDRAARFNEKELRKTVRSYLGARAAAAARSERPSGALSSSAHA